jgi:hypothetical protein
VKIVEMPKTCATDVPNALRELANGIEAGEFGDAHNMAWVMDCGDGRVEVGLMGRAPDIGPTAHLLFAIAQRKLEGAVE